jgi:glycine cleavage system H protein
MDNLPKEFKYTIHHEWLEKQGDIVTIGITEHAQQELGDVVHVSLPDYGEYVDLGDEVVTIEANKSLIELNAAIAGKIVDTNEQLEEAPGLINSAPYDDGWLYKLEIEDDSQYQELLDFDDYSQYIE